MRPGAHVGVLCGHGGWVRELHAPRTPQECGWPMKKTVMGIGWVVAYVFFAVVPLAIVALANPPHGRPFLVEFSVALGFVGLAMMGLQFALIARFKTVAAPFGI